MSALLGILGPSLDRTFTGIRSAREAFRPELKPREVGTVLSISTGIAKVSGLPGVGSEELIRFPGGLLGIAFNVDQEGVDVILLGDHQGLHAGDQVERTGRVTDIQVGEGLLSRVVDSLGKPLDEKGPVPGNERRPVEHPAPAIMDRQAVSVPLQTGLMIVDALVPVGRGQRELILGDRQSGKTAIAIDAILNQRGENVICVYCAICQRASAVAKVVARLQEAGAMEYTVVVVAEGNQAPGLAYIAPYAATTIAEYFMEKGRDVLIVYDDLTHHARAYRELSLLLRRPPGREAFPGDIFYIHSRMLERSTHLSKERGGGSLTALPIIETEAQDISAFIPTNLISITDGQIYLSPTLFELGVLPAVDAGKSVSRVGGAAQRGAYRSVAGDLKLAFSQFSELESFAKFGTRLDEATQRTIDHGKRIRACFIQPESELVPMRDQIVVLLALSAGLFRPVPLEKVADGVKALRSVAGSIPGEVAGRLTTSNSLGDEDKKIIVDLATKALDPFRTKTPPAPKVGPAAPAGGHVVGEAAPKPSSGAPHTGVRPANKGP